MLAERLTGTGRFNAALGVSANSRDSSPSVRQSVGSWLAELAARNYSGSTIRFRRSALARLVRWVGARADGGVQVLTRPLLRFYQRELAEFRRESGAALAWSTQAEELIAIKGFLRWCVKVRLLRRSPDDAIVLPRRSRQLPRGVLSAGEVEQVLAQTRTDAVLGLRDRALLETLYSTGLRRNELRRLALSDTDWDRGQLFVREGKGGKDRIVPVGERALLWIRLYLDRARPALVRDPQEDRLFLSWRGRPLTGNVLSELVSGYIRSAGLGKRGSCHLFRHTVATLLLEGGADIRHVQELLGHSRIETTQLYAHVSVVALKEAHRRAHPAERDAGSWRVQRDLLTPSNSLRTGLRALD